MSMGGGGSKVKQRTFPVAPIPPSLAKGLQGGDYGTIASLADPFGTAGGRATALGQYGPAINQLISSIGGLNQYAQGVGKGMGGNVGEWNLDVLRSISSGHDPFYQKLLGLVNNPSQVQNIPGYQFGIEQGMGNLQRQLAASGMSGSGAAMGELLKFAQGYASQQFTNQEQILGNLAQMSMASRAGTAQQTFADLLNRQQVGLQGQQAGLQARATGVQSQAGLAEFLAGLAGGNVSPAQTAQLVENMWNTQYSSAYGTPAQAAELQMQQQQAAGSAWGSLAGHAGGAVTGALGGAALGSVVPGIGTVVGGVVGGLGGLISSDRKVKKNIKKLGISPKTGLMMYSFDYKKTAPKHVGYMADEVEQLYPEAVVIGSDGVKRVNYSMLEAA